MSQSLQHLLRPRPTVLLMLIFSFGAAPLAGQTRGGPPPNPGVGELRKSVDDAKASARVNDIPAAEAAITRNSRFAANTAEWHMETTQKLADIARELSREGSKGAVPALIARALHHVDQVAVRTTDVRARGQAKAAAAVIHEQLAGDPAAAIAAYRAAVTLDPNDAGTKEALGRLERADAILRARIQPKGKGK